MIAVLTAGNADPNLLIIRGMVGCPANWPIETMPADDQPLQPGWQLMDDEDFRIYVSNNIADYHAWQATLVDPVINVADAIQRAMVFGRQIIADFGAENVIRNLSVQQVGQVAQMLAPLVILLQTGSLYTALAVMSSIVPDGVLLTGTLRLKYMNKIQAYLNLPLSTS